jgi:hypothetical protein
MCDLHFIIKETLQILSNNFPIQGTKKHLFVLLRFTFIEKFFFSQNRFSFFFSLFAHSCWSAETKERNQ